MEDKSFEREIEVTVIDKKFKIKFPTIGEYMAIERYKMTLSAGQYPQMATSGLVTFAEALDAIDMIAYYTVLCPTMLEHLKVETFSALDLMDAKNLMHSYKEIVKPWIDKWMKVFITPAISKKTEEKKS